MPSAHVYDDTTRAAEILSVHALFAHRAGTVLDSFEAGLGRPLIGRIREGLSDSLLHFDQTAQQRVFYELRPTLATIEQAARGLHDDFERTLTIATISTVEC